MNRSVFITGATVNTGLGIAEKFAKEGYNLFLGSRNAGKAEQTAAQDNILRLQALEVERAGDRDQKLMAIAEFEQALDYAKSIRDTWKQVMQASVRGK